MEPIRTLIVRAALIYCQLMLLSRSFQSTRVLETFNDFSCYEGKSFKKIQRRIITYRSCKSCSLNEMKIKEDFVKNDKNFESFCNKRPVWFLKVITQLSYDYNTFNNIDSL